MGANLYEECLQEDDDRAAWGDLSTSRIADLKLAAKAEAKEKAKTTSKTEPLPQKTTGEVTKAGSEESKA